MRLLKILALSITLASGLTAFSYADSSDAEKRIALSALLNNFLYGASIGDAAAHERFWAEDLVYTSSAGARTDKATIVANTKGTPPSTGIPDVTFSAEDVDIRLYDDIAVIAFKLIATPSAESTSEPGEYFNTGTFQLREGLWRAVAWQATVIPAPQ